MVTGMNKIPNPDIYEDYEKVLGQRSQTLTAFLGGITFGATTFLMQRPNGFNFIPHYSSFLIVWLAVASMFFIFSSAFYTIMALTKQEYSRGFKNPAIVCTWLAFASLFPFLVRPFSYEGFLIVLAADIVFAFVLLIFHILGIRREDAVERPKKGII
jgi:hypothetical protein